MSDIHGHYGEYLEMLDRIGFSEEDTLFVLGDMVDRGSAPMALLRDMMARDNVFAIAGNHDLAAHAVLSRLNTEITRENYDSALDATTMGAMMDWLQNGGKSTLADFSRLSPEERADVLDYLGDLPLYELADAGENSFILVHAGLGDFRPDRKLREYTAEQLAFCRTDPNRAYFGREDLYVVSGHTPTLRLWGKAEILKEQDNICIDCGIAHEGGRLACLCLDTLEEFYVNKKDADA
ncbi:MAG: metallophosphoesterase [Christensenellaceae bacterium]|nr:metallophosphoesterase [Christensenellaceae bacterium]